MKQPLARIILAFVLAAVAIGCGEESNDIPAGPLVWQDVATILADQECSDCHGNTPNSYDRVVDNWIEGAKGNRLKDRMEDEHRVSSAQADTILRWLDDGYPEM